MSEELKACPFCGGRGAPYLVTDDDWAQVECACLSNITVGPFDSESEAITAWNTRATDAENQRLRAEVREAEANINLKAEFIDATINQMAQKDQTNAELRAEVEALREACREYDRALAEGFPHGAASSVFVHWNLARNLTRKAPQ